MKALRAFHQRILNLFIINPSTGSSLAYLDGIRAIAVIFVVVVHTWWFAISPRFPSIAIPATGRVVDLTAIVAYMQVGVDLFFVLSGFLLAQHWLRADSQGKPRPDTARYFRQRFFRIAPAYYACLFLTLLFFTPKFIAPSAIYSRVGAFSLGVHLIFMQFLFPVSSGSFGLLGQFWTLTIEALFYLMLPWVIVLFLRNRWMKTLPVVVLLTVGWLYLCRNALGPVVHFYQTTLGPSNQRDVTAFLRSPNAPAPSEAAVRYFLSKQFPGHLIHFALGITLANLYVRYQLGHATSRLFRLITGHWAGKCYFLGGWLLVIYCMDKVSWFASQYGYSYEKQVTERGDWVPYYLSEKPFAVGFTLVIAGLLFGGPWLQRAFSITPLRLIGVLGYSIYLWHIPLLYLFSSFPSFAHLTPRQQFVQLLAMTSLGLVLICSAIYLAVEKPFILRGRTPVRRRLPPVETPVALPPVAQEAVGAAHD